MTTSRFTLALLAALALLLAPLATGCGGDDNGSADTTDGDGGDGNADADSDGGIADGDAPSDGPSDNGDADTNGDGVTTEPPEPILSVVHQQVFAPNCIACHGPALVEEGLDMNNDAGLRERLLADAVQLPSMPIVDPGDPQNSYLFLKLDNTHIAAGGSGDSMPVGYFLTADELELVRQWILDGAPE